MGLRAKLACAGPAACLLTAIPLWPGTSTASANITITVSSARKRAQQPKPKQTPGSAREDAAPQRAAPPAKAQRFPGLTMISLDRDSRSATRGASTSIVFDRFDDEGDPASTVAGLMYAPYRGESASASNWHVMKIVANGSSFTLSASVEGNMGSVSVAESLEVYCGGYFLHGVTMPLAGTKSKDWEAAQRFTRRFDQPFIGSVPLAYRLNAGGVSPGTYSGRITFTVVTR